MNSENKIFDTDYVGDDRTHAPIDTKSVTKEFIKKPIDPEEMVKYGTSKPVRIILKARITNG